MYQEEEHATDANRLEEGKTTRGRDTGRITHEEDPYVQPQDRDDRRSVPWNGQQYHYQVGRVLHEGDPYVPPRDWDQQDHRPETVVPPLPSFNANDRHFNSEYNRGFNAGYVRGHYVATSQMNNPEGHRMYQRYSSRWVNRGDGHSRPYRGRGGRGRPNVEQFTSTSGQQVQLLRRVNIPVQHNETQHDTRQSQEP